MSANGIRKVSFKRNGKAGPGEELVRTEFKVQRLVFGFRVHESGF